MPVMTSAMRQETKHVGCLLFLFLGVYMFTGSRENVFSLIFVFKKLTKCCLVFLFGSWNRSILV